MKDRLGQAVMRSLTGESPSMPSVSMSRDAAGDNIEKAGSASDRLPDKRLPKILPAVGADPRAWRRVFLEYPVCLLLRKSNVQRPAPDLHGTRAGFQAS